MKAILGEFWQLASTQIGRNSVSNRREWIMSALFESSINAHEHCLCVGTPLAPVGIAVLADDHRWPNSTLAQIVVEGHARPIEKREQIVAMTSKSLDQPSCL